MAHSPTAVIDPAPAATAAAASDRIEAGMSDTAPLARIRYLGEVVTQVSKLINVSGGELEKRQPQARLSQIMGSTST